MAYTKQNFKNGDVLTADKLNHIENGLVTASNSIDTLENTVDNINGEIEELKNSSGGSSGATLYRHTFNVLKEPYEYHEEFSDRSFNLRAEHISSSPTPKTFEEVALMVGLNWHGTCWSWDAPDGEMLIGSVSLDSTYGVMVYGLTMSDIASADFNAWNGMTVVDFPLKYMHFDDTVTEV